MGDRITFKRPDGQMASGYLATPAEGSQAGGLVVLQEWWGLNDQIKQVADRLATVGYQALVPDLYQGKLATSPAEAQELMMGLNWGEAASQDIQGAIHQLKNSDQKPNQKVAVIGFCMGGALTLISAANLTGVDAAVCFYGIPPAEAADPSQIRIPVQAHFANQDDWCTPALIAQLEEKLQQAPASYELYRYDAEHAFFNDQRPDVYNPEAAQAAWDRSLSFLKTHVAV